MPSAQATSATERLRVVTDDVRAEGAGARERWETTVREARAEAGQPGLTDAALHLAMAHMEGHEPAAALLALAEAEVAATDELDRLVVDLLSVRVQAQLGQRSAAIEVAWAGIARARSLADPRAEAMLLTNLGFVYAELTEPGPYAEYTRQALAIFRALGDPRGVAHCLCNLGGALTSLGRLDEAEGCYDEGLASALALGWRRGEALIQAGLGGIACKRGDLVGGQRHYAESRRILEELGEPFQIARHHHLLGRFLVDAGAHQAALEELGAALRLADSYGYQGIASAVHEVRSRALEADGDLSGALAALRRHLQSRDGTGDQQAVDRARGVELEHRVAAARREAESERRRSSELAEANEALKAALLRQQQLQDDLRRLAETDTLTGLCNRRKMREYAEQEVRRGTRTGRPFALLLLDVDHFKRVNDTWGHAVGDEVLVELAGRLVHAVRCVDVAARWGGEEFAVLLVDTDAAGAQIAAERVRDAVEASPFHTGAGELPVTVSGGLASWDRERDSASLDELLSRADRALYGAKRSGRNRIVTAG